MALSTRVWGAGKRVLLAGALVLTYLLFALASMRLALKTRDVVVPPLGGKSVAEASATLAAAGIEIVNVLPQPTLLSTRIEPP